MSSSMDLGRLEGSINATALVAGDIIAPREYRVLYFAIPKVANSSLKAICARLIRHRLDENFLNQFWSDTWRPRIFRPPRRAVS